MALRMLPIARPCSASFAEMPGDDKTRFCTTCNKHVHDLSARTEEEARALFREANGARLCVRFAKDSAGAVRFRAATIALAATLSACSAATSPVVTPVEAVDHDMGDSIPDSVDVCPDPPTPNIDDGCPQAPAPDAGAPNR